MERPRRDICKATIFVYVSLKTCVLEKVLVLDKIGSEIEILPTGCVWSLASRTVQVFYATYLYTFGLLLLYALYIVVRL